MFYLSIPINLVNSSYEIDGFSCNANNIFEVLGLPEEDRQDFEDLAGATRGVQFEDINQFFGEQPLARVAMRKAMQQKPSDDYWMNFIKGMSEK